jgi:hypothetical protein
MVELLGRSDAILPIVVGGNGKDVF